MQRISQHVAFAVMCVLSLWVFASAARIELLNIAAGNFLPRRGDIGKWRVSGEQTPRDQLRGLVERVGLPQYLLAPALIALAGFCFATTKARGQRLLAVAGIAIGVITWLLALYRGYFTSLGW
jgi:hypothetical protein